MASLVGIPPNYRHSLRHPHYYQVKCRPHWAVDCPMAYPIQGLSPVKEKAKTSISAATTPPSSWEAFSPGHKWTTTPALGPKPKPIFQPARLWAPISLAPGSAAAAVTIRASRSKAGLTVDVKKGTDVPALHSSDIFGHNFRLVHPGVRYAR